jgi:SAM-dependent methyltransferase
MHASCSEFVAAQIAALPSPPRSVLEVGARDVNGSVRHLFGEVERYVGVDREGGPGVDLVMEGSEVTADGIGGRVDVAVCTNVLEHVPPREWSQLLDGMYRALRRGGRLIIQAAGPGFDVHSGVVESSTLQPGEWYENVDPGKLRRAITGSGFRDVDTWTRDEWPFDVYGIGRKP